MESDVHNCLTKWITYNKRKKLKKLVFNRMLPDFDLFNFLQINFKTKFIINQEITMEIGEWENKVRTFIPFWYHLDIIFLCLKFLMKSKKQKLNFSTQCYELKYELKNFHIFTHDSMIWMKNSKSKRLFYAQWDSIMNGKPHTHIKLNSIEK